MTKKLFAVMSVLLVLTMLFTACAPTTPEPTEEPMEEPTEEPMEEEATEEPMEEETEEPMEEETEEPMEEEAEGPLVIAMTSIADQLDPMFSSSLNAASQYEQMFDPLVGLNDDVELVPALATEWSVADDGLTWTFVMREDATFWDGTPVTAEDVKYTIDRMTDPDIGATGNTQWVANNMQVESTEVVDEYTVNVITSVPVPALPYFIHEVSIMSKAHYEGMPVEESAQNPMGSGAYKYVEFVKDDHLTMEAHEEWWGGAPEIKEVVWREIPEESTRIAELQTGGADIAQQIRFSNVSDIEDSEGIHVESVVGGCRRFMGFKHSRPEFQDKRVRQAFNYAIDWETIDEALLAGTSPRMPVNVNPPWLNEDLEAYSFDPEMAAELLTEAGWVDEDGDGVREAQGVEGVEDGTPLDPTIMTYYERTSIGYEILVAVVDMLQDVGINAQINAMERSAGIDKLVERTFEDIFFMASCSIFEGQGDISDLEAESISNYGEWENEEFQALFEELRQEFDFERRAEILDEMQVLVKEEAPLVFLTFAVDNYGVSDNLNWDPHPAGRIRIHNASWAE
jgi:peptide/nickel transport system substrate-binding protein